MNVCTFFRLPFAVLAFICLFNSYQCFESSFTHEVTFTLAAKGNELGKVVIGLYGDIVPKTVANFLALAGEGVYDPKTKKTYQYKGSKFHRIIPGFMIQGGDVVLGNGRGSISKYGERFADENFTLRHTKAGILSMANAGPDTNGSQFFITTVTTPWLDGKHVVFGRVLSGMGLVKKIEEDAGSPSGTPNFDVIIQDSTVVEL